MISAISSGMETAVNREVLRDPEAAATVNPVARNPLEVNVPEQGVTAAADTPANDTTGRRIQDTLDISPQALRIQDAGGNPIGTGQLSAQKAPLEEIRDDIDPTKLLDTLREVTRDLRETMGLFPHQTGAVAADLTTSLAVAESKQPWWRAHSTAAA